MMITYLHPHRCYGCIVWSIHAASSGNGGENNNALYEEEDAEERVAMAEHVLNGADRAFQSASMAFIEAQKVVEEKKMVDALAWVFEVGISNSHHNDIVLLWKAIK